jgi:hypothetical protein
MTTNNNNNDNNDNDNVKSVILNLESLSKKYDTLLNEYNQVQTDYINSLTKNKNEELTYINGSTFWGTNQLQTVNIDTLEQCSALCSSTSGCSGATFKKDKSFCGLRTGDGPIVVGNTTDYAIVPKSKQYLQNLQILNSQMMDINNKILKIINKGDSNVEIQLSKQNKLLNENYNKLNKEKIEIEKQIQKYETLNQAENIENIIVTKNYYWFVLLLLLVLLIIIVFIFYNKKI